MYIYVSTGEQEKKTLSYHEIVSQQYGILSQKLRKKNVQCLSVERVISIPNGKITFLLDSTHSIRVIVVFKNSFTATNIYIFFWYFSDSLIKIYFHKFYCAIKIK